MLVADGPDDAYRRAAVRVHGGQCGIARVRASGLDRARGGAVEAGERVTVRISNELGNVAGNVVVRFDVGHHLYPDDTGEDGPLLVYDSVRAAQRSTSEPNTASAMSVKPDHELRRAINEIEFDVFTGLPVAAGEARAVLGPLVTAAAPEMHARVAALVSLCGGASRGDYLAQFGVAGVTRFVTSAGATIFCLAAETYPSHVNNIYLIHDGAHRTLIDCGSDTELCRADLRRGATVVAQVYGVAPGLDDVGDVVITHGHVDHFTGIGAWAGRARVHVHEFDARALTHYAERIVVTALQKRQLFGQAGFGEAESRELEQMYLQTRRTFTATPVDRLLTDGQFVNGLEMHHTPGHSAGQICPQLHDILFTADHVLPCTTPHLAPESVSPWTGLDHYFLSLRKVGRLAGITLALPGHEEPISGLEKRITEIGEFHHARLDRVRASCQEPRTLAEITVELFGARPGYVRILALEEAAAHVEYLARRGWLEIANADELATLPVPVVSYRAAHA